MHFKIGTSAKRQRGWYIGIRRRIINKHGTGGSVLRARRGNYKLKTRPNVVFKLAPNHLQNAMEFDDALISTQRKRSVLLVYYHSVFFVFQFFFQLKYTWGKIVTLRQPWRVITITLPGLFSSTNSTYNALE